MVDFDKALKKAQAKRKYLDEHPPTDKFDNLSLDDLKKLSVIWSTELMGFFDLCSALRKIDECPAKGEKAEWGALFRWLGDMEAGGWILAERIKGKLEHLVLSDEGADAVREYADGRRPILVEAEAYSDKPWEENKAATIGDEDDIPF